MHVPMHVHGTAVALSGSFFFVSFVCSVGTHARSRAGIATGYLEYHFFNDECDSVHYSASGSVVEYVRNAEMLCTAGDIILSTEAWGYLEGKSIHSRYIFTTLPEEMVKVELTSSNDV